MRVKETKAAAVQSKKRLLEEDEVDHPRKRVRTTTSRRRNADSTRDSNIGLNTGSVQHSTRAILDQLENASAVRQADHSEDLFSYSGRSGRAVRLPTRFR